MNAAVERGVRDDDIDNAALHHDPEVGPIRRSGETVIRAEDEF